MIIEKLCEASTYFESGEDTVGEKKENLEKLVTQIHLHCNRMTRLSVKKPQTKISVKLHMYVGIAILQW